METPKESRPSYRMGCYIVDGHAGEVLKSGVRVKKLSPTHFAVLYQLVEHKGALVLREEFTLWPRKGSVDRRNPVDTYVSQIKKRLGDASIIEGDWGKGYRLSPALHPEIIKSPSLSELERRLMIALEELNAHTTAGFRASIDVCQDLLTGGRIEEACSAIALAYINLGHTGFCRENRDLSLHRARKVLADAIEWFPAFGSAYALRGLAHLLDYKWDAADADFTTALGHSPDNEYAHCFLAHMLAAQGSFDAALDHARIAARIDYGSAITVMTEPWMMLFAGHTVEAVIKGDEVVRLFGHTGPAHAILGDAYCAAGELTKALEQYKRALDIEYLPGAVSGRGFVYGQMGLPEEARGCLTDLETKKESGTIAYVSSWHRALVYAGLRETMLALDALDKAFEERSDWLIYAGVDPHWKELRGEEPFQNLLRRIGITKPWTLGP